MNLINPSLPAKQCLPPLAGLHGPGIKAAGEHHTGTVQSGRGTVSSYAETACSLGAQGKPTPVVLGQVGPVGYCQPGPWCEGRFQVHPGWQGAGKSVCPVRLPRDLKCMHWISRHTTPRAVCPLAQAASRRSEGLVSSLYPCQCDANSAEPKVAQHPRRNLS